MLLLIKFTPQSLRSLAKAQKIVMQPWYRNLAAVSSVWVGVAYAITCFMKWSWNTKTLATLGSLFSSRVVSMLVKSTCKRSIRAVATTRCRGTLDKLPSCCKQCAQDLIDCCISLVMPGHQKCYCNKDRVQSHPWWPASWWHPFKAVTQWALGTPKSRRSSVSPLGIECRYKAPWWTMKFCWLCKISLLSSLEACSARSALKSVLFCAYCQFNTVLNDRSSFWASAQSVTCICTSAWPVATCTSCSKQQSPSTMVESWTLAQCTVPNVTLLRIDLTVSRCSWVVSWLSASATMLSHPSGIPI